MPLKINSSYLAQTKALISCATTVQFHICKSRFSHEAAHLKSVYLAHAKVWFCSLFAYAKSLFSHDTASIKSVNLSQTKAPISCANIMYLHLCLCLYKSTFSHHLADIKYSFKHKQRR